MGIFGFFTEDVAIDLGTANLLIMHRNKVVVDGPSVIAINRQTGKVIAIGREAGIMMGKTHDNIKIIRPLKDGVIADFDASEKMINAYVKTIPALKKRVFAPALRMAVCIPSGITEVEMRAVRESAERANAREVYMVQEPLAAAIGMGIGIMESRGSLVVDIGGGTTEVAVISLGGIVCDKSVKIAGDVLTDDIIQYVREEHNLFLGEVTAEKIKMTIGAATEHLEHPPDPMDVQGRDLLSGKPKQIRMSHTEIARALDKSLQRIEAAVMEVLSATPPELSADIYNTGIHLAGGGALLKGLDKRLTQRTDLPVCVAQNPLRAIVEGTNTVLKEYTKYRNMMFT
ncbi:rod shape-determining protein [Sinomicrobium soli]|uniref:rod shape-determining protein n=1 Tax=Sinomicrobium sp. N-1-3-6 TaxID=2219864 RepID=UPI000DCD7BDF|nr:rod shape-determining protein [Sinomicrobium sp. N-1-3-6]RAV27463.1 rod shape-determining protein [Sinomicrobium sp. N-1-3-6]